MELVCEFKQYNWTGGNQEKVAKYTCDVKEPKIIEPTAIKEFHGKHIAAFNHGRVAGVIFSGVVENIPSGIKAKFAAITSLSFVGCGLIKISKEDLKDLGSLQTLELDNNKLTTLDEDLLINTPNLQRLTIVKNQLENLPSNLLEPVKKTLAFADFRYNPGSDFYYDKNEKEVSMPMNVLMLSNQIIEKDKENAHISQKLLVQTKMLEGIFNSGQFSDFKIKVHGKERNIHKCILAAQSSLFAELFRKETEGEVIIEVTDFGDEIFDNFMRFFYSRNIKNDEHLMELFVLSSEFNVTDLKSACVDAILNTLDESKALKVFNLGTKYSSELLKRAGFDALKKKFHPEIGEYLYGAPDIVNGVIKSKLEFIEKSSNSLYLQSS